MGNSNDKPAMGAFRPAKENRSYLIEVPSESGRRSESPLPPGSNILVEDTTNSARFIDIPNQNNRRRPVLCYQSSSDYGSEDMPEEFTNRFGDLHVNTSNSECPSNDPMLQTVFKWEGGGQEVFVTGTFSDWKPLRMVQSQGDFVTVVDIPEGLHKYKFLVDGIEMIDRNCAMDSEQENNVLHVKQSDFDVLEALEMDLASNTMQNQQAMLSGSPPGSYSQTIPNTIAEGGPGVNPPILPPHLLQVILNNPVTVAEPTILPQPNHVMLNHLYALSIKDGVMVLSDIHRYRKKYVTTLLYKPI